MLFQTLSCKKKNNVPNTFIIIAFQSGMSVKPNTNTNQEVKNAIILQLIVFVVERLFATIANSTV